MNRFSETIVSLGAVITALVVYDPIAAAPKSDPLPHLTTLCPDLRMTSLLADGSNWPKCTESEPASSQFTVACTVSGTGIDVEAFRELRTLLLRGLLTSAELCQIETELIKSLTNCNVKKSTEIGSFVELALRLSINWARVGKLDRAKQLYLFVYQLLNETDHPDRLTADLIRVLEGLTNIQIKERCDQCAEKLAYLQVDLARSWYVKNNGTVGTLVSALTFYADTLEKIGKRADARKARDEAALVRASKPCEGICGDSVRPSPN